MSFAQGYSTNGSPKSEGRSLARPAPPQLIERSGELDSIGAAVETAMAGTGTLTVVAGPPGIGKTALLRAAAGDAEAEGCRVWTASGTEMERGFPLGVVGQLFRAPDPAEIGNGTGSRHVRRAPVLDQVDGVGSVQALDQLYWGVHDAALAQPLLLAVDDSQWSDPASLRFLGFLCRRLEGVPVSVLLAKRDGEAAGPGLDLLWEQASHSLNLEPLTAKGVGAVARRILGRPPSAAFVSACYEQTGGYPLYVEKLLEAVVEEGGRVDEDFATEMTAFDSESLAAHVWRRIEAAGEAAVAVAELASVIGEQADPSLLSRIASLPPAAVAEAADRLASKGVLQAGEAIRFAHPVIHDAVRRRVPIQRRESWQRRTAQVLDEEGADVQTVAAHLFRCLPIGEDWVVDRLQRAAERAMRLGAPVAASETLRRALEEPVPRDARSTLLVRLAAASDASGHPLEALEQLSQASKLTEDLERRAEIAVASAGILATINRYEDAALVLGTAFAPELDRGLMRRLETERVICELMSRGVSEATLRRLDRLGEEIPEGPLGMAMLTARATASVLTAEPVVGSADLAARALGEELGSGNINTEIRSLATWILIFTNHAEVAQELNERDLSAIRRLGHLRETSHLELLVSCAALHCGDLPAAVSHAQSGVAIGDPGPWLSWGHANNALALLEVGDLAAGADALSAAEPEHWAIEAQGSYNLHLARCRLRIDEGRTAEAEHDLREMRKRSDSYAEGLRGLDDVWRMVGAEIAHRKGEAETARRLASEELDYARQTGAVEHTGRMLRISALVGEPGHQVSLLRESVEILKGSPARLEQAKSLIELGAALRRRGERVDSREPLRDGLELAYRCGANGLVSKALAELRAAGARPRSPVREGPEALTPREARMARMAAKGKSNREIAQELYVTVATVEGTLWRAYAKLGISGKGARGALSAALGLN